MRVILAGLIRCAIWYAALFWTMTGLFIIVTGVIPGSWRFYCGVHRRKEGSGPSRLRGPVRRAGAAGSRCRAGPGACSFCAGPGLSQVSRGSLQFFPWLPDDIPGFGGDVTALAGGIRLRYAPAPPLNEDEPGPREAAAVRYMRNQYARSLASPPGMTMRLFTSSPPSPPAISGSGYTRGGLQSSAPAHIRAMLMNQPQPPGPHPVACPCIVCMRGVSAGPIPGCRCPVCVPSLSAASQPPSWTPSVPRKPKAGWGMDGFDGAELVAGTALGYRWWTLNGPQLHRSPASAGEDWDPGLLRGVRDFWQPGINQARCLSGAAAKHPFEEIPYFDCACGYWAYWGIQQHDLGRANSLPVIGVVRASGQVIIGPRGFRAQKAEIIALHLPFRIQPDLPALQPPRQPDYQTRALPGSSRTMTHRRFTGKVINYGGYVPAPFRDDPPPVPVPPTQEEIRAATDAAEAWEAVIADRLQTMYPGAEVCATLDLMKAKYPVKSEYAPSEPPVRTACPYCGTPCDADDIHKHVMDNHYF